MLAKIKDFVKTNPWSIILFVIVVLVSLLSFAAGFLTAKYQEKEPIKIQNENTSTYRFIS